MARPEQPTIAIAQRTYMDGVTRDRVKAGTRFAIEKPQGALPVMPLARFKQLSQGGLVRALKDSDLKAAPQRTRYAEQGAAIDAAARDTKKTKGPATKAPGVAPRAARPSPRLAARRKTHPVEPQAPERINGASVTVSRAGSPTGEASQPSSSPEVRPSGPLTSRKRGTRAG